MSNSLSGPSKYLFKCETDQAVLFKFLIEVLQGVLTDVCFQFQKDGIKLDYVDSKTPHELFTRLHLRNESFNDYYCSKKNIDVGLNLLHFYKLLKNLKKNDKVSLQILRDTPDQLQITILKNATSQVSTSNLKIQNIPIVNINFSDEYNHPIHYTTINYQQMCKDFNALSSKNIQIYSKGKMLKFSCGMQDVYTRSVSVGRTSDEEIENEEAEEYKAIFGIKNLHQLIKIVGLNEKMQIYIPRNEHTPLKISVSVGGLGLLELFLKSNEQISPEEEVAVAAPVKGATAAAKRR